MYINHLYILNVRTNSRSRLPIVKYGHSKYVDRLYNITLNC